MQNEQDTKREAEVLKPKQIRFEIPRCCLEGWESCPHTIKPQKKPKTNVGL